MDSNKKSSENFNNISDRTDLYKRMIDEIQDYAMIFLDINGIITKWNKGAQNIKLYSDKEVIGKHFSIFYLTEDLNVGLPNRLIKEAHDNGRASHEGWRKRKDNSKFWGNTTITAIHDEDNEIIGYCKITIDLTDKKIAEDNLRMSEERYHQMIAEVQDYAIILLTPEGVIQNWNIGAENIKGYKSHEIIGKKFEVFYSIEDREVGLPYKLLETARKEGKASHQGWRLRKDGTKFWGNITITALHSKDNNIIGFSKVTRDLTQQKIADDKLAAYTEELELQNSELEQFAYIASHDLQEPLRKIQTFTGLIKNNLDDKEYVNKYFEKMELSARRLSELVKSLLNYSRLSKQANKLTNVNLNNVLEEIKNDFELLIDERKATVKSNLLPTILGNQIQLEQLFFNIISNSLKFSISNPVIEINSYEINKDKIENYPKRLTDDRYICISFKDNGIGFESQYSQRIFTLFQRLHGKQEYSGTGIGLALCRKVVERHGGYINATSIFGKGATFNVYLPLSIIIDKNNI